MANLIIWNCLNEDINASRPLGAHQLSGWLRSHGYTVKVIDFCHALSTDALVSLTEMHIDSQTVGIGVSSVTPAGNPTFDLTGLLYFFDSNKLMYDTK